MHAVAPVHTSIYAAAGIPAQYDHVEKLIVEGSEHEKNYEREAGRLIGRVHPLISFFITKGRTLQHRRILQRTLQTMQPCTFSLAEHLMHPLQSASALHPLISFCITKRRTLQLGRIRRWTLQPAHSDWRILKIWRAECLHVLRAGLRFHNA